MKAQMTFDRREFLFLSGASFAAARLLGIGVTNQGVKQWNAQWIWYPGQLAAYRHSRRIRLAMERCSNVGYPANFRQPITQAYFRKTGTAERDVTLRWSGPVGRIRTLIGGRTGDITARQGVLRSGQSGIEVQIDFAQSLPCFLLEGAEFSTGATWEASLDGKHWVPPETGAGGDPQRLPDADREITVSLPVYRAVEPKGAAQTTYSVGSGSDVLLDFRETELGALRFEVRGQGELTIQVGESLAEVRDPDVRNFEQYPLQSVSLTEQSKTIVLPQRALRFVRFATSGQAELRNVRFDASLWPAEEKGRFESSDQDLNAIWTAAVATLRSNMHDFYLDGIRRDGLLWHDGPLTLDAYERVFFDVDLSRQTLIGETLPEHPSIRDVGIIDSPMYDVIGFEREFLVRGDAGFSQMFRDRIEDILRFYAALQNELGFVNAAKVQPYGFFPDWSATEQTGPDGHGTPAYGQILLAATFASAARLAAAWKDEAASARYEAAATRLRNSIRETFWRTQDGLYSNGLDRNGKLDLRTTSFAQAFAVAYDVAKPDEYDTKFRFLNDESKRPAHYSLSQVVELTAYAKAGRAAQAMKRLKSAWLPMIQSDYHRFFEDVEPAKDANAQLGMYGRKYATSLCHAWAGAAPVMALSRGVLGIEPVEPGYIVCAITPQRCGLDWVRGAVPTNRGPIEIEWRGTKSEVSLPSDVTARLADGRSLRGPGRFSITISQ
jgi:alpha-L-rhamnosidase